MILVDDFSLFIMRWDSFWNWCFLVLLCVIGWIICMDFCGILLKLMNMILNGEWMKEIDD